MDDYTWEKTIRKRRVRRRRQALLVLILVILALGAFFGWHLYAQKRTPEYALEQAVVAVQKKDADRFRHYVNLDLVTSRGYDDLTARTCSSTWAALLTFTSGFTSGANGRTMSANTPSWPTFSSRVMRAIRDSMRSATSGGPCGNAFRARILALSP